MSIWYALCEAMHLEFLHMTFMKNALLAVLILAPLFGLLSTMIVTGRMSFFSDALGHSGFTGIRSSPPRAAFRRKRRRRCSRSASRSS